LGEIGSWTGERAIEVDQSNESIVVGERAVVERSVRTAPDDRRPMLLPAHLSEAGFAEMPAPLGTLGWWHEGGVAPLASIAAIFPTPPGCSRRRGRRPGTRRWRDGAAMPGTISGSP
jgi:hypothetical protein